MDTIAQPPAITETQTIATFRDDRSDRWSPTRLVRLALGCLLVMIGAVVLFAPAAPSEGALLAAAARQRASLRYDLALSLYSTASAQLPNDAQPHCLSAQVYALQQEWSGAVRTGRHCVALAPGDAPAWLALGDALAARGDASAASTAWQRAAVLGQQTAWRHLATQAEMQGCFATAEAYWAQLPHDDPQALMQRGLLALERGDGTTAQADFIAVGRQSNQYNNFLVNNGFLPLAARPLTSAADHGKLGYSFLKADMPSFALAPLRQASKLDPTSGSVHAYLGWTLWLLGQQAEARTEIVLGPKLTSRLSFAWFAAGEIALAAGNLNAAQSDLQRGIQLDQRNPVL